MMLNSNEQEPFNKKAHDDDKIRRFEASGCKHQYRHDEWLPWTGNGYIKSHYDMMLPDGTIVWRLWPNAGILEHKGIKYGSDSDVKVRLSETSPFAK